MGDVIQIGGGEKPPAPDPMPQGTDRVIALLEELVSKLDTTTAANAAQLDWIGTLDILIAALLNRSNAPQHLMFRWVRTPRDAAHAAELRHLALEIADALAKQP
jgi:hypothetical protein